MSGLTDQLNDQLAATRKILDDIAPVVQTRLQVTGEAIQNKVADAIAQAATTTAGVAITAQEKLGEIKVEAGKLARAAGEKLHEVEDKIQEKATEVKTRLDNSSSKGTVFKDNAHDYGVRGPQKNDKSADAVAWRNEYDKPGVDAAGKPLSKLKQVDLPENQKLINEAGAKAEKEAKDAGKTPQQQEEAKTAAWAATEHKIIYGDKESTPEKKNAQEMAQTTADVKTRGTIIAGAVKVADGAVIVAENADKAVKYTGQLAEGTVAIVTNDQSAEGLKAQQAVYTAVDNTLSAIETTGQTVRAGAEQAKQLGTDVVQGIAAIADNDKPSVAVQYMDEKDRAAYAEKMNSEKRALGTIGNGLGKAEAASQTMWTSADAVKTVLTQPMDSGPTEATQGMSVEQRNKLGTAARAENAALGEKIVAQTQAVGNLNEAAKAIGEKSAVGDVVFQVANNIASVNTTEADKQEITRNGVGRVVQGAMKGEAPSAEDAWDATKRVGLAALEVGAAAMESQKAVAATAEGAAEGTVIAEGAVAAREASTANKIVRGLKTIGEHAEVTKEGVELEVGRAKVGLNLKEGALEVGVGAAHAQASLTGGAHVATVKVGHVQVSTHTEEGVTASVAGIEIPKGGRSTPEPSESVGVRTSASVPPEKLDNVTNPDKESITRAQSPVPVQPDTIASTAKPVTITPPASPPAPEVLQNDDGIAKPNTANQRVHIVDGIAPPPYRAINQVSVAQDNTAPTEPNKAVDAVKNLADKAKPFADLAEARGNYEALKKQEPDASPEKLQQALKNFEEKLNVAEEALPAAKIALKKMADIGVETIKASPGPLTQENQQKAVAALEGMKKSVDNVNLDDQRSFLKEENEALAKNQKRPEIQQTGNSFLDLIVAIVSAITGQDFSKALHNDVATQAPKVADQPANKQNNKEEDTIKALEDKHRAEGPKIREDNGMVVKGGKDTTNDNGIVVKSGPDTTHDDGITPPEGRRVEPDTLKKELLAIVAENSPEAQDPKRNAAMDAYKDSVKAFADANPLITNKKEFVDRAMSFVEKDLAQMSPDEITKAATKNQQKAGRIEERVAQAATLDLSSTKNVIQDIATGMGTGNFGKIGEDIAKAAGDWGKAMAAIANLKLDDLKLNVGTKEISMKDIGQMSAPTLAGGGDPEKSSGIS